MNIKQAVISAGGFGTRLRPVTDTIPKPMLPIVGRPMLLRNIEHFKKHGVTEFFLTLHHLPQVITDYFGDGSKWGVKMHYFTETAPLGSAGGLKMFEDKLDQHFFFMYGDMLSYMDYTKMAKAFEEKPEAIGMQRMKRTDDYADADVAELDESGAYIKIHKKPHAEPHPNAYRMRGVFIFDKRALSYIPEGTPFDLGKDLLPAIVEAGEKFYSYECGDYTKGIDTEEKWKEVEEWVKAHPEAV